MIDMKKLLLILMLCSVLLLSAEERKYISAYLYSYPQTVAKGITAPSHWDTANWLTAAGIVGIGTGLYIFDEDINRFAIDNKTDFTRDLSFTAKQFGEGKYILPAIALTGIGGYVLGSEKTTDTSLLCLKSFLLANGTTQVLKAITQRERPDANRGKEFFGSGGYIKNRESFPSGHATVAWSVAPVIAAQYREIQWIPPLAYGIATLTSCSRVHDNKHWASDAFAGSVIGYFTAKLCLSTTPRLQLLPNPDLQGISFHWEL
jgi:membrane-associated phospholipid phosphatase